MNKLKVKKLTKSYGGIHAVQNCSFSVDSGTIVGLIGPNGAGKTTVFNLIGGFVRPDSGSIVLDGAEISNEKPHIISEMGIARTFQIIRLFPDMTLLDNVLVAFRNQKEHFQHAVFRLPYMKKEEKQNEERALELLEFVGLHAKRRELAKNLSYGQQKLLEIARALAAEPELLMLDEPAAGVNLTMLAKIKSLLLKLKERGKTILLVEHNMEFVMEMCDKVVVMDHGVEIAEGKPKDIQKNKKVLDAYLGGVDDIHKVG